ncbi:MAG: YceI family protein [Bacteroidia bacterium]|jgi:polyisoprenoid-binding protein YceI
MTKKITMGLVAAAAITAFAFTAPKYTTTYTVDTKSTSAAWLGKKVTGQHNGKISVSKGTVTADHGSINGGTVEFDMNSITCEDLTDKEWNGKLVGHLKSDDFFSTEKFPTAKFEVTKATLKKENDYDVTGKLTIKGITNEITFPAKIKMDEKTMVVIAKITVNRTKYDIKYGSASFFESIGDKAISDDFELDVNLVASAK